ncbi:hypothetical protein [Desulfonatronum thioautotrophicum]|uniref:hypothetical protein n=1 Tax=Desulfonatronum thioautotrophicum TaxID=617001 RepID=UPI00129480E5|nr:hypothetical protein [Desulfonatronum thioautotrophicum]
MKIGGENRPEWIMKRHWERMAEELGLKPKILLHDLTAFCKTLETAIVPTLQALEPHGRDAVFLMRLEADIRKRIAATLHMIGVSAQKGWQTSKLPLPLDSRLRGNECACEGALSGWCKSTPGYATSS